MQTLYLWILFLLYLIPILIIGTYILRKISAINRLELLIPTGSIFGITLFIFLLHIASFFFKGSTGIISSYLILFLLSFVIFKLKIKSEQLSLFTPKVLLFYVFSNLSWISLIFWKGSHALIGSDTNLYYSIAHTFIKGNFPPFTPWQSDLPLSYHMGASELLGSFNFFTNLPFEFLHIFFSCLFIFLTSQIIVWIWRRHESISSLIWGNMVALVALVSFGFLKIALPTSFKFPEINSMYQLFMWIRNLPTVNDVIEVYGAPINLDVLIYFIHHAFGIAVLFSLIVIIISCSKEKQIFSWIVLLVGFIVLLQVNESIFIISIPSLIVLNLFNEVKNKTLNNNKKYIILILLVTLALIVIEGGVITNSLFPKQGLERTVLLFPQSSEVRQDFVSYHYYQQISKEISQKREWLPFVWFHIGADVLILMSAIFLIFIRYLDKQKILVLTFFAIGVSSLAAYNYVVPKYLVANGNRFLALSLIILTLTLLFSLQSFFENYLKKKWYRKIVLVIFTIFVLIPTILPPLALLTKNRFGENKLVPKMETQSGAIKWMKQNLGYNKRVMVLDAATPHPSGMAKVMVHSGVFAPIFRSDFRAYTVEASPEYLDIAYFLNPSALKKLKIDTLYIDSNYYSRVDELRKIQLSDSSLFEILYEGINSDLTWEKVYKIQIKYLDQQDIKGGLSELEEMNLYGKIFIDNEEGFDPSYIRRALIFSLRGKDLYYLPQSGVYLNVEVDIPFNNPSKEIKYNYLLLSEKTDPKLICSCMAERVWDGFKGKIVLWKNKELF